MGAPTLGSRNVSASNNQSINGVLGGPAWNAGAGQPTSTITYSFPTSSAPYGTKQGTMAGEYPNSIPFTTGFSALTSAQVTEVQRAFALVSSYTGLGFPQVTETPATPGTPAIRGDIRLANASSSVVPTATAWFPGSVVNSGDVFFGSTGRNPQIGNFDSSAAVLHEVGHALGLKHGEDNAQPFGALPSNQLSQEYSVMNYSSYIGQPQPPGSATVAPGSWPQTYMMDDIAALQYLYGANFSRVGQDVTYTWSPISGQEFINGVGQGVPFKNPASPFAPGKIFMTVWTQGANSTYDLSNFNGACYLDMRPGGWMNFDSGQRANLGNVAPPPAVPNSANGNVYNALLYQRDTRSEIANLITGNGNDTVYGNDVFDTVRLGNGNDVVNCGGGGSQIFAGNGNDILNGGAGNETFTLTGGTYTVDGGTGNNILDLTRLTPVNNAPFTINNNDGTGTVFEGTLQRVTFSGITSIEEPGAPTTVAGGLTGESNTAPPAADVAVAQSSANAGAPAGPTSEAASVSASTVNGASSMSFIPGDTQVNPVDVAGSTDGAATLIGGPYDTLTGGRGADTFVFSGDFGQNTITNYNVNKDTLQLDHSAFGDLAALIRGGDIQQVGTSTIITNPLNHVDTITLTGASATALENKGHFSFV